MKIGILPLARPTFDVPFAQEKLDAILAKLSKTGHHIVGPSTLLFDENATTEAMKSLHGQNIDRLLLLQVTFTDASMTVAAANHLGKPISIWAVKEPRSGGRLRLNAFCGLNLASHALGLNGRKFSWVYSDPSDITTAELDALFSCQNLPRQPSAASPQKHASPHGTRIATAVRGKRIARIGAHPNGFDTCAYSASKVAKLSGVTVDALELDDLFAAAHLAPVSAASDARKLAQQSLKGLDQVDQAELDKSLRLKAGLDKIRATGSYDAFAIRCWPEAFTQYGGAVCGPASMLGEARVPCACEADVYGALTQLILQEAAESPVFLTDLVDMDKADNTGVVWHCGQAPISMRDQDVDARATIHTNRKMPLLFEFPLKAGPVTFMRISQAFNQVKMVIGFGEMLKRPMSFTGTSGVVRFEREAGDVVRDIISSGLEHHMALTYGDHRCALRSVAAAMDLPILEL